MGTPTDNKGRSGRSTFQAPRGTRDFYPQQMAECNWLFDIWRRVSHKHGFEEYDGPLFESLDLYTVKSGQEIVSQLFSFQDRGGRNLALRPEITPTLARMIAARAASLARPIKWFSIPRACRAERPQRGRLREFFQWNIDVVGSDSVLADAECIFVLLDMLRSVGLGPDVVELQVNSRTIVAALLEQAGIGADQHERVFSVIDKYEKLDREQFRKYALDQGLEDGQVGKIMEILEVTDLAATESLVKTDRARAEFQRLTELREYLNRFGVGEYFHYRPDVVRGLAYYTGIVFEVFDRGSKLRAIAGGGRYDHLIRMFGGPAMPAVGFGMGDIVIVELLGDLGRLPQLPTRLPVDFFVIDAETELFDLAVTVAGRIRSAGLSAELSYKRQGLSKQLKQANARYAKTVVILGSETNRKDNAVVTLKNLADGSQHQVPLEAFVSDPAKFKVNDNHATQ